MHHAHRNNLKSVVLATVCAIAVFLIPHSSIAARIIVSPSSASVTQGKTVTVNIMVSTPDASMNAVSGTLTYPTDLLSVVSTSTSGSVLGQWLPPGATGPQKSSGSLKFEGVSLGGYQGTGGKLFSVTFKALKEGAASLSIANSSILANDGAGTDITAPPTNGQITVTPAVVKEPEKPAPEVPVVVPTPEPIAPAPVVEQPVTAPVTAVPVPQQVTGIVWSQAMFYFLIALLLLFVVGMMGTWIVLIHLSRRIVFLEQMMMTKAAKPRRSRKKAVTDGTMPTI